MSKKVSVIMPVYLGEYEGCASDRETKFLRAVSSVLQSSYKTIELVVIGDSCSITEKLIEKIKTENKDFEIIFFNFSEKQPLFSGSLRSKGIELSSGEVIIYIDSDDMYSVKHIETVVSQIDSEGLNWCYFNDFIHTNSGLSVREVELEYGLVGTSSIAHIRENCPNWNGCNEYGHDWMFIQKLIDWSDNYDKIYGTSYIVCHIPTMTDF
jgi:glycosyltransferase involved in cell wall biosynthesis